MPPSPTIKNLISQNNYSCPLNLTSTLTSSDTCQTPKPKYAKHRIRILPNTETKTCQTQKHCHFKLCKSCVNPAFARQISLCCNGFMIIGICCHGRQTLFLSCSILLPAKPGHQEADDRFLFRFRQFSVLRDAVPFLHASAAATGRGVHGFEYRMAAHRRLFSVICRLRR